PLRPHATSVHDEPVWANTAVTTAEDTTYTFVAADFPFSDPNDSPANGLDAVKITTLPATGSLVLTGASPALAAGDFVSKADIDAGKLKYTPAANGNGSPYTSFTFQVRDNGGTPGQPLDQSANTLTINVTSVNDEPVGANNAVTTAEDTTYTFVAPVSSSTLSRASPANGLDAVKITTLPATGSLVLTGASPSLAAGDFVSKPYPYATLFRSTPAANGNGSPYT